MWHDQLWCSKIYFYTIIYSSCISSLYFCWVIVVISPNGWYFSWPWQLSEPQHGASLLVSLLLWSSEADFIYFMSSSIISCTLRINDSFEKVSGLFLVYFLSFLFLMWLLCVPSVLRYTVMYGFSILINSNNFIT